MLYQRISLDSLPTKTIEYSPEEILSSKSKVRESMKNLPRFIQPFLTWLTAVPLNTEKRSNHSSLYHFFTSLLTLTLGIGFGHLGLHYEMNLFLKIPFILLAASFSLSSMRKLQVVIVHHCSHSNFFSRKNKWNERLGSILSFMLFTEPFKAYQIAHIHDHHFTEHMTEKDPTVKFLFERVGLKPGMSVNQSTLKVLNCFLSPKFYLDTFKQRLLEQKQASVRYQFLLAAYWAAIFYVSIYFENLPLLTVSYTIPLFILYPISSALRLVVEHTFPEKNNNRRFDLGSHSYLTNAVFCGEEYPSIPSEKILWFIRMILIHLPSRFLILVGDTPVHDHHHRNPLYLDWPNYAFARKSEINSQNSGYSSYREVWGFHNAFKHSLKSLENQRN